MSSNAVMKETPETVVAVLPKPGSVVSPREEELGSEVSEIEIRAQAVVIRTDQDYELAGQFGVMLKQKAAEVTEFFKPMKDTAYKAHKAICDREKEMLTPLRNAEKTLKKTTGDYAMEQERKRREAEEAARRAAEEEARRKLEEAAALEKSGDVAGAEAALQDAEVSEDVSRMVFVPGGAPKAKGVSAGKDWEIVSIDGKSVPLMVSGVEIRPVDTAAVMRLIRASKGSIQIPGIVYREVAKMSFSRRG